MTTIKYTRRYPIEQYGYEEWNAECENEEELAAVRLTVDTLISEREKDNPDDGGLPFEDEPPHPAEVRSTRNSPQNGDRRRNNQPDEVECGICGGRTWDNIRKKQNGDFSANSPDFSCRDREKCGAAMWLTEDGDHGEWKLPKSAGRTRR